MFAESGDACGALFEWKREERIGPHIASLVVYHF
jgi:hypothetical protein